MGGNLHRAVPVVLDGLDLDLSPPHLELGSDYDAVEHNGGLKDARLKRRGRERGGGGSEGGVGVSPRGLLRGTGAMFPSASLNAMATC